MEVKDGMNGVGKHFFFEGGGPSVKAGDNRSLNIDPLRRDFQVRKIGATSLFAAKPVFFHVFFCIGLLLISSASWSAETLHFWIKAFIPSGVPTEAAGRCFKTDDRNFSSSPTAPARLSTEFTLVFDGSAAQVSKSGGRPFYMAGRSVQLQCDSKTEMASATADVSSLRLGQPVSGDGVVQIVAAASAANPLTPPVISPKIDYDATLSWKPSSRTLNVRFTTGRFPAFEAYAQQNDGPIVQLLAVAPDPDASPFRLYDFGLGVNTRTFVVNKTL